MKLRQDSLKKLLDKISNTRPEEIGCTDCFNELDKFADMLREGQKPEAVMPLVQHHLDMCGNCHEEFDALLSALELASHE